MSTLFHSFANRLASLLVRSIFACVGRVYVLRRENAERAGGFLLAANHISHFDPPIISSVVRRKIDWMAMAEFFPMAGLGHFLRAVDAFPAARDRADRKTIRTAIERLRQGRIVGLFPEGGIRDGTRSLLEGAPLRPGASTLAHIAQVPILPCVILGTDRFYAKRSWLPFRRTPIWIAFGDPIPVYPEMEKEAARTRIENELISAFRNLYSELKQKFQLSAGDLPHSPQERMRRASTAKNTEEGEAEADRTPKDLRDLRALRGDTQSKSWRRISAKAVDTLMCASMNVLQMRHRLNAKSRDEMERYVTECQKMTAHDYYAIPNGSVIGDGANGSTITWRSPIETKYPANDMARADLFPSRKGWGAPTVLMLHALLSASDIGYRRLAARFNELGWNACFVHLPYHYSRVPRGYWNGELAITADLKRNAEGLRQGVIEVRQLMNALRARGCNDFGILGTSYGGWIGALLAMTEPDFRFVALMAPITNVEHAIWASPACVRMRRELRRANIEPELVARHYHLSSPTHNMPACDPKRILFAAGDFDLVARRSDIEAIHQKWKGSQLLSVAQGHFGYRMMRETVARIRERFLN